MGLSAILNLFSKKPTAKVALYVFSVRCDCEKCKGKWEETSPFEFWHLAHRAEMGMFDGAFMIQEMEPKP